MYKWLWTHIGKRMWTWIIRDSWLDLEIVWILGLLWVGAFLGKSRMVEVTIIGSIFFFLGHLFWGTRQVYHQGLKEGRDDKTKIS